MGAQSWDWCKLIAELFNYSSIARGITIYPHPNPFPPSEGLSNRSGSLPWGVGLGRKGGGFNTVLSFEF